MKNLLAVLILNFVLISPVKSADSTETPALRQILNMGEDQRMKELVQLLYNRYFFSSAYDASLSLATDSLRAYNIEDADALAYFAESLILRRKENFNEAEKLLFKAIDLTQKSKNTYLLTSLYTTLAFAQTGNGDALGALHSYRLARAEAEKLKDKPRLVSIDLGLADIYRTLQLYNHALFYLDEVNKVCSTNDAYDQRMRFLVCKTKGDVFFMMRNRDSVNSYYDQALKLNRENYDAERDVLRLKYYTLMLAGQYEQAIPVIKKALKPTVKYFRHIDRLNLAESYFKTGNHELALSVIEQVVADSAHAYAFIKIYSYTLLGDIAMSKNRFEEALRYRTLALNESEKNIRNMAKVSDLTSQMRLDKIKTAAETQAAVYKKERTVLVFGLIATALGAVIIGLFYNNIRQRSRYAKLLSDSRDKELTFVNSHKTRKHLANILGFCNLVKESNPEKTELITYFKYVETSAYDMDEWLKEVDRKLKK